MGMHIGKKKRENERHSPNILDKDPTIAYATKYRNIRQSPKRPDIGNTDNDEHDQGHDDDDNDHDHDNDDDDDDDNDERAVIAIIIQMLTIILVVR